MKSLKKVGLVLGAALLVPGMANAGDFVVSGKADFVSDYIWRGIDQNSGFSIQPSLTFGYKGLSLNAWGSQTLSKWGVNDNGGGAKEFDINLSYSIKGFTVTVSDYWWSGTDMQYGDYKNDHYFEGTLAYNFGEICDKFALNVSWSTMFAGADKNVMNDPTADRDNKYSTYVNLSYPVSLPADITLTPALGFTPWKGYYYNKAAVTDISIKASKDIQVTDKFAIPVFVQALVAPAYDRTYLLAGFSLGF